jgi:hypothetical protein
MFEGFYSLIILNETESKDGQSTEFWHAIMSLDWRNALFLASDNIHSIHEYLMIFVKVLLYHFSLGISTLSGTV